MFRCLGKKNKKRNENTSEIDEKTVDKIENNNEIHDMINTQTEKQISEDKIPEEKISEEKTLEEKKDKNNDASVSSSFIDNVEE